MVIVFQFFNIMVLLYYCPNSVLLVCMLLMDPSIVSKVSSLHSYYISCENTINM